MSGEPLAAQMKLRADLYDNDTISRDGVFTSAPNI